MTLSRSFTFVTSNADHVPRVFRIPALWIVLGVAGGVLVRALRLDWQPLWWDEGYSIYFATEPLTRMFWLTARDIHPPFYYTLLHTWFNLIGDTGAVSARLLSILLATAGLPLVAWTARVAFPERHWLPVWALLLLAINPFHIYHSQEVRMYGLALALSLASTAVFLKLLAGHRAGHAAIGLWGFYIVTATFSLMTLYYTGFVILAHQLIALWSYRRDGSKLRRYLFAAVAIMALAAPWWAYTVPRLLAYVADKVIADQDTALGLLRYLWRHLVALAGGHIPPNIGWETAIYAFGPVLAFAIPTLLAVVFAFRSLHERDRVTLIRLATFIAVPVAIAYAVSLRLPFFPEGSERLLLFVLPYAVILVAYALDLLAAPRARPLLAALGWLSVLAPSGVGLLTYYTTPRYVEHDYRPIIRYVTQHGGDTDTVVALFPWQIGYWRAYSPRADDGGYLPPQPPPLDQEALVWSADMAADLHESLRQGIVWFPAPLSFGSTLPRQVESYLSEHAANVDNRWFGTATRLSAWVQSEQLTQEVVNAGFDPVTLVSAGVGPHTVSAANAPVFVDLVWRAAEDPENLRATLRLVDESGRTWAQRDLSPLGGYPAGTARASELLDRVAIQIPVGTPPGAYHIVVGVGRVGDEQLFPTRDGNYIGLLTLDALTVMAPAQPLPAARLAAPILVRPSMDAAGIRLIGYDAPDVSLSIMAGTPVELTLFMQATVAHPTARDLALFLAGPDGVQRAAWQGWPLPGYPTEAWPRGALITLPVVLDLPANMPPGRYRIQARIAPDVPDGLVALSEITVYRRAASFAATEPSRHLDVPVQFGAHVHLIGYDLTLREDTLDLALHWEAEQPLLPPHHIFVHLYDPNGERIAQQDGPPQTATGAAPTGSWLPGERLITLHTVDLAGSLPSELGGWTVQVGLYRPKDEMRLPTSVAGDTTGNAAILPLP